MISAINTNASALAAFSKQMAVSANNVANVQSDEFDKSRALNVEGENGGVKTQISKVETQGPLVEDPLSTTGELKELSNTNLAEEFTGQIATQHGYEANAKAIQTQDQTIGVLLDLIG